MRAEAEEIAERTRRPDPVPEPVPQPRETEAAFPPLTPLDLIGASNPGELDVFPLLMLIRSNLRRTILCAFIGVALAATFAYTRHPRYSASASILIPQQQSGTAASAALQAATGLELFGGGYEVYLDILKSRSVADRLIDTYHLEDHYHIHGIAGAEAILESRTSMFSGKEGMIWIIVQDEDKDMAANLANSYFSELAQLNTRLGITAAGQLRRYYEVELLKEKDQLADAEVALEQSQQKNGMLAPQVLAGATLSAEEDTRARLRALQVQEQGLLQSETPQNPDVQRVQAQIAGVEGQLHAEESTGGPGAGTPDSKQPAQALDYIRKDREVKFHESLMDMLTRQLESARAQESKDISLVEPLDRARPSQSKAWPPKKLWIVVGFVIGSVFGILWSALEAFFAIFMSNPSTRARFDALASGKISRAAAR